MSLSSNNRPKASSKPHIGYICMSTVDDLSYTPSAEEQTRDAAQIVATGRRSWKTLKGRGEAVWPPHLEAALIEALEKYRPDESRSNKTLGRFSMRNRFISDYIFESTGKRRTPKQVGSRLQQLRDTCKSERILQLISRRSFGNDGDSGESSSSESPSTSPAPEYNLAQTTSRRIIWVNVVLERSWSSHPPVINILDDEKIMPLVIHLAPNSNVNHSSIGGGLLSALEPRVTLASPCNLEHHCSFSVHMDGGEFPIHGESSTLTVHSSVHSTGGMYSASLVPELWQSLCGSAAPTRFTIVQTLYLTPKAGHVRDNAYVSVVYNFTHPESTTELSSGVPAYNVSNFSSTNEQLLDSIPSRAWSTGSLDGDIDWSNSLDSYTQPNSAVLNSDLPRYDMPTLFRGLPSPTDSWINGQMRFRQQVLPNLSYC